jgi:hypothetical protein
LVLQGQGRQFVGQREHHVKVCHRTMTLPRQQPTAQRFSSSKICR